MDTLLRREVEGEGPENAQIVLLAEAPSWDEHIAKRPFQNYAAKLLLSQFLKAGVLRSHMRLEYVCQQVIPQKYFNTLDPMLQSAWRADCFDRINALKPNVVVPLGAVALNAITNKGYSIDNWHLSIIPALTGAKCVPLFSPERILRNFKEVYFLTFGAYRVAEESKFPEINIPQREFKVRPSMAESLAWLKQAETAEWLSVDIETSQGRIRCVGFSSSPDFAISIPTDPSDFNNEVELYEMWAAIARVLEGPSKKVFQNGIYDTSYFSRYGIKTRNFAHDTMIAQKFLYPELPMGLDTIARLHTKEPYWKDEAKDWGTRQNVEDLYRYNAKDASVTLEAAFNQLDELKKRGLYDAFKRLSMDLTAPVAEMCWRGLPVDSVERERLQGETKTRIDLLTTQLNAEATTLLGKPVNPKSPTQVKNLLKAAKMKVPMKMGKESSDLESLMRLQLKYPESKILPPLIQLSSEQKLLSSYLSFAHDDDARMRYTLRLLGTENGRMSCNNDPWDRGMNAQTIPSEIKSIFRQPEGWSFVEVDLKQADARVVAWDAPEPTLMQMFNDGADIHRFVASQPELFNCSMDKVTKEQRQLGKKTGHAANYGMRGATLSAQCLKEMNLVVPPAQADRMLEGYHRTFPGIRRWQSQIRDTVMRDRKMTTPFGRERYFYDRPGDELFREAYAYRPPSIVVDVINSLIKHMYGHVRLLLQVHDSALFEVRDTHLGEALDRIRDQHAWNPILKLSGGELRIPIEIKRGNNWGRMEEIFSG